MKIITALILLFPLCVAGAQNKYWVSFTDKNNTCFDPYTYFDQRAIERRIKQNLPLCDSLDFPVNEKYLEKVKELAGAVTKSSRWLNGVAIVATPEQIEKIIALSFVKKIVPLQYPEATLLAKTRAKRIKLDKEKEPLLNYQTARFGRDEFVKRGVDGRGIRIAVFDVGFPGVDKSPAFSEIIRENRIVGTYDFIENTENVYRGHWHGTATLSCIGGRTESGRLGLATGSEFLLARTEKARLEDFSEEENWLAAAEWADRMGANIISSSIGYSYKRYFNYQMDGHHSLVANAATIAASKGILVVNSAGNEGLNNWLFLVTPADADSVLTVGGTNPYTDSHIKFSSFGPSATGKLKPNVCATGRAVVSSGKRISIVEGTSFSAPLVAGFAACAWQSQPTYTNMELFDALEKSSHLFPYYDYAHGFGIPQASLFYSREEVEPTFDFVLINNEIKVFLREQYSLTETEELLGFNTRRNFFYKIENAYGSIRKYKVLLAGEKEMLHLFMDELQADETLTVHFEGYTKTFDPNDFYQK